MDLTAISDVISTVGFPIAAFGLMYYMVTTTLKDLQDNVVASNQKIADALNTLRDTITELKAHIER